MRIRKYGCPARRGVLAGLFVVAAILAVVAPANAFEEILKSKFTGVAMEGYDTTAYLTAGGPEEGDSDHTVEWKGAKWRFASKQAAEAFAAAPQTFAPQFGGYCTGAMALGKTSRGDPGLWRMKGRKLYLFQSPRGPKKFDKDPDGMIAKAKAHWERRLSED